MTRRDFLRRMGLLPLAAAVPLLPVRPAPPPPAPPVLVPYGDYDPETLEDFRRRWNALIEGSTRRWRMPVLTSGTPGWERAR